MTWASASARSTESWGSTAARPAVKLRRNATFGGYDPEQAQSLSDHRRRTAWKWTRRLPSMIAAVADRLLEEWSPEQISGFIAPIAVIQGHKQSGLVTLVERRSGYLLAARLLRISAELTKVP